VSACVVVHLNAGASSQECLYGRLLITTSGGACVEPESAGRQSEHPLSLFVSHVGVCVCVCVCCGVRLSVCVSHLLFACLLPSLMRTPEFWIISPTRRSCKAFDRFWHLTMGGNTLINTEARAATRVTELLEAPGVCVCVCVCVHTCVSMRHGASRGTRQ
jgi:hypothetical protein